MIDGATTALDAVIVVIALLVGYLAGSIPTARLAGSGEGAGWAFLARTIDVAKGVVPVAIGIVTWSWWIGWVAGAGSVLGFRLPAFGRDATGRTRAIGGDAPAAATLAGAASTLAPPAGAVSALLAAGTLVVGRVLGRDARVAAATVGFAAFPALFLVVHQDLARLGALLVLYLLALVPLGTTRGR